MKIHISPSQEKVILTIIKKHFPKSKILLFGSRVRGDHKQYSDLDICLDDQGQPLPLAKLSMLEEELSQTEIPFKIDIVDWNRITSDFQQIIMAGSIPAT
jgi:predicted nucleotidyltransferase